MDKPTAFLDAATARFLLEGIKKSKPAKTVIVISHDPLVESYCDLVIGLD